MKPHKETLLAARKILTPESHWPISGQYSPPGWRYFSDRWGGLLTAPSFPTIEDWQPHFHQSPYLSQLKLKVQMPLSVRKRRSFRKTMGLSPLGYYLKSICEDNTLYFRQDNWHDFFNNLIWLTFPQSKLKLHRMAFACYQKRDGQKARTPLEDRITRFDEGGMVVCKTQKVTFGHGLLEASFFNRQEDTSAFEVLLEEKENLDLDTLLSNSMTKLLGS